VKAIQVEEIGSPDVLRLVDVPEVSPGPGQVRIRARYAGVNFADINLRRAGEPGPFHFPVVPGLEVAGFVDAVGPGVSRFAVGDRVSALTLSLGGYAELVNVDAKHVFRLPDDVSLESAAALTLQGLTAHYLLHDRVSIAPGSVVLVHAAAGGMGLLLTQWASHLGARVFGTVSSEEKAAKARAMGAEHVFVHGQGDFAKQALELTRGRGVDYVIDGVGTDTFSRSLEALKTLGHLTYYGWASGAPALDPRALMAKSISLHGGNLFNAVRTEAEASEGMSQVFSAVKEGWLRQTIFAVLPLSQASDAHRALEGRGTVGKVLLRME
jgi:NADPH2:quinone reductase